MRKAPPERVGGKEGRKNLEAARHSLEIQNIYAAMQLINQ